MPVIFGAKRLRLTFRGMAPVAGHIHGHGVVADQLPHAGATVATACQVTNTMGGQEIRIGMQKPLKRRGARLGHSDVNPEHLGPTCKPKPWTACTIRDIYAGFAAARPVSIPARRGNDARGA